VTVAGSAPVRPACDVCPRVVRWRVRLYVPERGTRDVGLCGAHVRPFRADKVTAAWTVLDLVSVEYRGRWA
jgi:hypothetical protein